MQQAVLWHLLDSVGLRRVCRLRLTRRPERASGRRQLRPHARRSGIGTRRTGLCRLSPILRLYTLVALVGILVLACLPSLANCERLCDAADQVSDRNSDLSGTMNECRDLRPTKKVRIGVDRYNTTGAMRLDRLQRCQGKRQHNHRIARWSIVSETLIERCWCCIDLPEVPVNPCDCQVTCRLRWAAVL